MVQWVRKVHDAVGVSVLTANAGGDALALHGPELSAGDRTHLGRHTVRAEQSLSWALTWFPSWLEVPSAPDPQQALARTTGERSEEHTSELQSRGHLVCRLLLEKKKSMYNLVSAV